MIVRYKKHPWRAVSELPGRSIRERIDPRRLGAARRALEKRRDAEGLFAGEAITDDEAVARLVMISGTDESALRSDRQRRARDWRRARRGLLALPPDVREELLWHWNKGMTPAEPAYLLSLVWSTHNPTARAILAEGFDDPWLELRISPTVAAKLRPGLVEELRAQQAEARERLSRGCRTVAANG